jgi:hypothetical protein
VSCVHKIYHHRLYNENHIKPNHLVNSICSTLTQHVLIILKPKETQKHVIVNLHIYYNSILDSLHKLEFFCCIVALFQKSIAPGSWSLYLSP